MDRAEVRALLAKVAAGDVEVDAAIDCLAAGPLAGDAGFVDMTFARLDTHRGLRTGDPEVIYAAGKTPEQTLALLHALAETPGERPALVTRLDAETTQAIRTEFPSAAIDDVARCAAVGSLPAERGQVCVVTAGTSDGPVAAEAAFVARAYGSAVE